MRKHTLYHFIPPILASKTIQTIMFFQTPILGPHFSNRMLIFFKKRSIWEPHKNPVGAEMGSNIDQVAPTTSHFASRALATLRP